MGTNTTDRGAVCKDYSCSIVEGSKHSGGTVIATGGPYPTPSEVWTTTNFSPCEISSEVFTIMVSDLNELTNREDYSLEERKEDSMEDKDDQALDVRELIKLPLEDRRRILKKAAQDEDMRKEYEEGGDLRKFQALGEDDFYADP